MASGLNDVPTADAIELLVGTAAATADAIVAALGAATAVAISALVGPTPGILSIAIMQSPRLKCDS
jgi:hypothetical protein